jgi:Kef-type K+ transport system membrane component KefB
MSDLAQALLTVGSLLILGFATDALGRRTGLPRVTLLVLLGVLIGPSVLDLLPDLQAHWFPVVAHMALVMVGFLLGAKLDHASLRQYGRQVLGISLAVVVSTAGIVLAGLTLVGVPLALALLLAGIATATDPAATADVVRELRADGRFTRTLLGIVAIDDAWGLIAFSFALAAARALHGEDGSAELLLSASWEIGGAVLLGVSLGIPMAYLTGRVRPGEPTLAEALGIVFLSGGIAIWADVSFLLASMVLGTVVANLARHHTRPFHTIEGIEWPFMILFFVLAGASLDVRSIAQLGLIGSAYVVLRVLGRAFGGWTGAMLCQSDLLTRRWIGMALMPQAGVALGMALVAAERFPELRQDLLPVVIATVVLFELIGPILTRRALLRSGESPAS